MSNNRSFDWIVVGAGITGSALSYELKQAGFSVLLLEQSAAPYNATYLSYGGIPYWSGTTDLTRQLCREGIELQRQLTEQLDADTEFRELDLVLTIEPDGDPQARAALYKDCAIPPALIDPATACQLEPLLNPNAIAGALTVRHAQVNAALLAKAYQLALVRAGGTLQIATVKSVGISTRSPQNSLNAEVKGVITEQGTYYGDNIVVCAGGMSRSLLKASGIQTRLYFTHAEVIETVPTDLELRALVMPAMTSRFQLEREASSAELDPLWNQLGREIIPASIDAGAVQFRNRTLKLGQISRAIADPEAQIDPNHSEAEIRTEIGQILPSLANLKGTWHRCLVAFTHDSLPLIGSIPGTDNLHLFSGFTSPMALVPPLARRFAAFAAGAADPILSQLSPQRFV